MTDNERLKIRKDFPRLEAETLSGFTGIPTGWAVDAMGRRGSLPHWIHPITSNTVFLGSALPVYTRPVDNLSPYAALAFARPGDVLVVACDGALSASVLGDILLGMARNAGIVAAVTDGLVRDVQGLNEVGIPVFSRGLSPNSPRKDGPGTVGLPVSLGDVIVHPGDLVLGDDDGVVIVPADQAVDVLGKLETIRNKEQAMDGLVKEGATRPPWLDDFLLSDGVKYLD